NGDTATAPTDVISAESKTNVYTSNNGTTVVEISTANSHGLSHNKFYEYNVTDKGVVLNNTVSSGTTHASELAGSVPANQYSNKLADIILNEVITTNQSELSGYTEVVGKNADVIIANPNGITCNGCGFINTNKVSLTTGNPLIDGTGKLNGFEVNQGNIHFGRQGADLTNQEKFNIVARGVSIDGNIVMDKDDGNTPNGTLNVIAGTNEWDHETDAVTEKTADADSPSYAIDSTVFGGIQAGQITFKATEDGVGVKVLANAAASADDFIITADGTIEINSKIKSARDVIIDAASNAAELIISGDESGISADEDIIITASNTDVTLNDSTIVAESNIEIESNRFTDDNSGEAQRISTSGSVKIKANDDVSTSNSIWKVENGDFELEGERNITSDNLKVGSSSFSLKSTGGDISLTDSIIESENDILIESTTSNINLERSSGTDEDSSFVKSISGDLAIDAGDNLTNNIIIATQGGSIDIKAEVFDNNNQIQSNDDILIDFETLNNNNTEITSLSNLTFTGTTANLDGEVKASGNIDIDLTDALSLNIIQSNQNIT
ncbi:MAG: filamentous hemagglutinin N-terminal domain-containing protein, partial [Endozoicomonas sp.]